MAQVGHLSAEMTRYYTHLGTRARERAAAASEQANLSLLTAVRDHAVLGAEPERSQMLVP